MPGRDTTDIGTDAHDRQGDVDHERLRDLIHRSLTAEFTSIRDGKPVTYPLTPFYDEVTRRVVVSSPPAFAGKIENVRRDPGVAILLNDEDGEYVVVGAGHMRESDPESNAEYVRDLIRDEPETHKRRVFENSVEFIESVIGRRLMGWYGLRVVVEFEPISMTLVADSSSIDQLPAWTAVDMSEDEANSYERAILSFVGDDGYPKMQPVTTLRIRDGSAALEPDPTATVADGQPACLLLHWHDDEIKYLGQRVIRGRFRTKGEPPMLVPGSSFTLSVDGALGMIRFIIDGKRRTKAYFRNRG